MVTDQQADRLLQAALELSNQVSYLILLVKGLQDRVALLERMVGTEDQWRQAIKDMKAVKLDQELIKFNEIL